MKRHAPKILAAVILLAAAIFLTANKSTSPLTLPGYIPYGEIPAGYSLADAKADGCVVFEELRITSGQAVWDAFVNQSACKKPCFVRLAFYYAPDLYIHDLAYDGNEYSLSSVEDGRSYRFIYKYLIKCTGTPSSPYAAFSEYTRYVLVNDDTVTWERIERGMLSARSGDSIDHKTVYINLE